MSAPVNSWNVTGYRWLQFCAAERAPLCIMVAVACITLVTCSNRTSWRIGSTDEDGVWCRLCARSRCPIRGGARMRTSSSTAACSASRAAAATMIRRIRQSTRRGTAPARPTGRPRKPVCTSSSSATSSRAYSYLDCVLPNMPCSNDGAGCVQQMLTHLFNTLQQINHSARLLQHS